MKKLIFFTGLILAILILGAGYWYLEIYSPAKYAKAALSLWEQFYQAVSRDPELTAVNFNNEKDYEGALRILRRRVEAVEKTRNELLSLSPTRKMKEIHADISFVMEGYLAVSADALRRAEFFANAVALNKIMQPDPPPFDIDDPNATVRQYQDYFESAIPAAKAAGDNLFASEPPALNGEVSFTEFKQKWEEEKPALDTMLLFIRKQNPNMPLRNFNPVPPTESEAAAMEKSNQFGQTLESVLRSNTATGILSYVYVKNVAGITEEEFEARYKKLEENIENLKKKYGK